MRTGLRRLGGAVAALAVCGAVAVGPFGTAVAGVSGADAPLAADAPKLALEVSDLTAQLEVLQTKATAVESRLTAAAIALDATDQQLATTQTQIDRVRAVLREQAAAAYVHRSATGLEAYSVSQTMDLVPGTKYLQVAGALDGDQLAGLERAKAQLDSARVERAALRDQLAGESEELDREQRDLTARRHDDEDQLQRWGAVTVMGDTLLTASELAGWYRSTGAVPSLEPGVTIDDIAQFYVEEGTAEHVRGDLAFAQAIVETGSFKVAAGNNFSGIGVCDSCTGGYRFDTPRDGVRAQIQLLRNYADPESRAANLRYPPAPGLYGKDSAHAAHLYDTFFLKGKVPLWNQMGNGNWATDTTYAPKVIAVFAQLILYANAHPTP